MECSFQTFDISSGQANCALNSLIVCNENKALFLVLTLFKI
jgi:hypothetical protein